MLRRNAIKYAAVVLGTAFSPPTLLAMNHWKQNASMGDTDFVLNDLQRRIVAEVAEMIIPRSETPGDASPGANDVGVPAFIETMLKDCYKAPEQARFVEGLRALEQDKFLEMEAAVRTQKLKALEAEAKANGNGVSFWRLTKELTLIGYFTSEAGIKSSFEYVQIPSKFIPIQLKPNQKAYAY